MTFIKFCRINFLFSFTDGHFILLILFPQFDVFAVQALLIVCKLFYINMQCENVAENH